MQCIYTCSIEVETMKDEMQLVQHTVEPHFSVHAVLYYTVKSDLADSNKPRNHLCIKDSFID